MLVFLGGTCGNNNWRESFINELLNKGFRKEEIFNPVVPDWNEDAREKEEQAKKNATYMVFYLASPMQEGNPLSAYSMVEATMALYGDFQRTVVIFDTTGMDGHALKAMNQTNNVLRERFSKRIFTRETAIEWLGTKKTQS